MRASGRAARIAVAVLGLVPFAALAVSAARDRLGADPVEALLPETGQWALRFLLATLAITPARRLFGWSGLAPHRRTLGLLAFFYAGLHFSIYLGFDLGLDFGALAEDVLERPFITVGMTVFLILLVLALTSNRFAIRKLGRKWQTLHRLVYVAAIGGVIHFWQLVKADETVPTRWAAAVAVVLGVRVWWSYRKRVPLRS